LACDFDSIKATTPIDAIKGFVNDFGAELHVLNVDYHNRHFKADTPMQSEFIHAALENFKPTYHYIENQDIEDGINEFAETNNLDIVITIPKKHKRIGGLFKKSSTRQLVFESHVPIMCIHE
jgi:hypothetical protein